MLSKTWTSSIAVAMTMCYLSLQLIICQSAIVSLAKVASRQATGRLLWIDGRLLLWTFEIVYQQTPQLRWAPHLAL